MGIEATAVNIEELEKKIPVLLASKIFEDMDLTSLARLTPFNKACIPTISKLTGTFIQGLMLDVVCLHKGMYWRPN